MPGITFPRSLLFVPGNRAAMFPHAWESDAQAVVFDLEDSVPADQKPAARELIGGLQPPAGWDRPVYVRLNAVGSSDFAADVEVAARAKVAGVPYAAGAEPYRPLLPLITDRVVDALTLAGTADEVAERLVALGRAGIGQVMIHPFAPPGGTVEDTIAAFAQEALPRARRALEP